MVEIRQEFIEQAKHLTRNAEVLPGGVEELAVKLQHSHDTKTPLRVKLGMDPTRPDLHLGHTVVMRKLKEFQNLGHQIVLIVGGATAMVGDPSGKTETRPALTKEQVDENAKSYFDQMSKVLDVTNAEVVNNADWLHSMSFTELLKLSAQVTVAQMMTRDDFAKRYSEGRPISIHEFFYPLMQAYDSVAIDSDIELGGTDQRFNTLLGRDIQAAYGKKYPQLVMLLPLLEGTDGVVKMSKTYPDHCISLTDSEVDMFGKLMSIPDHLISRYFSLLTDASKEELEMIDKQIAEGSINPRDIKIKLAYTITAEYHGEEGAKRGQDAFINICSNKGIPDDIQEVSGMVGKGILDVLVELNFVASKGEAKRLIQGGGVKLDGVKIADQGYVISFEESVVLQAGKRKFAKLVK
ncbi:tyrosine--tRNA ligase [bacterium]|nr:tyrosine--tRNA ligase [bacterium]